MKTILALLLLSASAHATNSINIQTFNPSVSDHFVLLEDAYKSEWPKNAKIYFGANYNYVSEPLVALTATGARAYSIVDAIQTFDLMIGFKASSRFGLFFGAPIHIIKYPDISTLGVVNHTGTGLGDLKILGKIRLTDDDSNFNVALVPEIHLPTGATGDFVSDASTYLGMKIAMEREFTKFTLNGNIGFAAASNATYQSNLFNSSIDYRQRFLFGIGGFLPFTQKWGMNLEYNSIHMIPFDKNVNPNELYLGLRHAVNESAVVTFGGSIGKIGGDSGQNYRIIAGLRYTLFGEDAGPVPPSQPAPPMQSYAAPAVPRVVMKAKRIELSEPVMFEENSSLLTQSGKDLLDEVADVMAKNRASYSKILIDGHTNNKGQAKHNLWLSLERSKSVKHYLVGKGIAANTLEARGFGQTKPKVSYSNPKAMEINRRVEFNVIQ